MPSDENDTSAEEEVGKNESAGERETPPRNPRDDEPEDMPSPNEILGTLMTETSLWPLLIVVLGSLGTFGAGMLVLALGDRNPFAAAALLLVVGMTIDLTIRSRTRPELRNIVEMLGLFWMTAVVLGCVAVYAGIT